MVAKIEVKLYESRGRKFKKEYRVFSGGYRNVFARLDFQSSPIYVHDQIENMDRRIQQMYVCIDCIQIY